MFNVTDVSPVLGDKFRFPVTDTNKTFFSYRYTSNHPPPPKKKNIVGIEVHATIFTPGLTVSKDHHQLRSTKKLN